ncbi:MAG: hypothetical protein ABIR70_20635 [Bryobacteraceae bacterium]
MQQEQPKVEAPKPEPPKPNARRTPPAILFDSDMGQNIDAALALAVLYNLGAKGKLSAVGVSRMSLEAAAFCDIMSRFYSGAGDLSSPQFQAPAPVGLPETGPAAPPTAMLTGLLGMKKPDGKPLFTHGVQETLDTADARVLYRNTLLTQNDLEGIVVLAGPATNLVRTLDMSGAKSVVTAKVGLLVVAAGAYPEGAPDPRIRADIESAKRLFATWPSPIVAVGIEAGEAAAYSGSRVDTDFAWSQAHPVAEAYRAFGKSPYDAPAQAALAAYYAGNPQESFFKLSEPGRIEVLDDGRTRFVPSATGKHRYLIVDATQKAKVVEAYAALASMKPAVPAPRGRPPQAAPAAVKPLAP